MLTQEQIQQAAARLAKALQPQKIILFGSYARGEATEYSDLDLMVIEPRTVKNEHKAMIMGRDAVGSIGVGVDVLVYDRETFNHRADWCSSPIHWARVEGKVLHDEAAT